jgi:hypothetical protein
MLCSYYAAWMIVKIKVNDEHYEINISAPIVQHHIFQQTNCSEYKLLTVTLQQIFNTSFDF